MTVLLVARLSLLRLGRDRASLLLTLLTAPGFAALHAALPGPPEGRAAYLPGLLVFSVLMVVFSSAIAFARELETGAFAALRGTPASPPALIVGAALAQLVPGLASLAGTLAVGAATGALATPGGGPPPLLPLLAVGAAGAVASIGLGILVAAWARRLERAFLAASVLMFLQVLLSGLLFPRPALPALRLLGHPVTALDLLPTTHLRVLLGELLAGGSVAAFGPRLLALLGLALALVAAGAAGFARVAERGDGG
jgi:ABC-2 type transport system permease protein